LKPNKHIYWERF